MFSIKVNASYLIIVLFSAILLFGIFVGILDKLNFFSSDLDTYKAGKMDGYALRHLIWGTIISNMHRANAYLPHLMIVAITYLSLKHFVRYYIITVPAICLLINPTIILYGQTLLRDFIYFPILLYILTRMHVAIFKQKYFYDLIILFFVTSFILLMYPIFTLTISGAMIFALASYFFSARLAAIASLFFILISTLVIDVLFHDLGHSVLEKIARTDQTCGNLGLANLKTDHLSVFIFTQIPSNLLIFNNLSLTFLLKIEHILFLLLSIYALSKNSVENSLVFRLAYGVLFIGIFQLTGENCEWSLIRHKIIFYAPLLILLCRKRNASS